MADHTSLKIWDGAAWLTSEIQRIWDGSAWVGLMKYWNGSAWIDLHVPQPVTFGGGDIPDLYDSPSFGDEEVGAKYDGTPTRTGIFYYQGNSTSFPSSANGGDWQGNGAPADYDCKWELISGTPPNIVSHAAGVWVNMDGNNLIIEMDGITATGQVEITTRDANTLQVINVDAFEMKTE